MQDMAAEEWGGGGIALKSHRGEIPAALERLSAQLDSLEQAAQVLGAELQPILRSHGPERITDDPQTAPSTGIELADRLQQFAERLQGTEGVLRVLIDRSEL